MNEGNLPNPVSPCTTIGAPVTRVIFIQQPNKQTQRTLPITGTAGGQQMPRWDHSPATYGPEESQWPGTLTVPDTYAESHIGSTATKPGAVAHKTAQNMIVQ